MSNGTVTIEKHEHVAHVRLNRPDVMNALNQELIDDIYDTFHELDKDRQVRVIVLSGEGRAFCAGGDISFLNAINAKTQAEIRLFLEELLQKLIILARVEKPIIGALHGYVLGAGLGLAMHCDLRIASESTTFGAEFPMMGIVPEVGITYMLPAIVGLAKAMELVITARRFAAAEAERIGILNKVVPDDSVLEEALKLARQISHMPPVALGMSKIALRSGAAGSLETSIHLEANMNAICYRTEDHKEATSAFLEKRTPIFKGC